MIVEIIYYGGKKLIVVEESSSSMEDYLDAYRNITENPTVIGFIDYIRDRGVIVEPIEPYVLIF